MGRTSSKPGLSQPVEPFHSPFAGLAKKLEGTLSTATPEPAPPDMTLGSSGPRRAVLRLEKKGRGGKEVTVVEQLELPPVELERWLKDVKQALGTGGSVEGGRLVLQGDHRERLRLLLLARGVRRVSVG